jgi:hypothetical protein
MPVEVEPFKSALREAAAARKAKTGNPRNTLAPWLLCAALHSQTISEIATMSNLDHPAYRPAVETDAMAEDAHAILVNKVSWGAIFSGVVVALVVQILLTMLGAGIGIATLDPGTSDNPDVSTFSIVAGLWYVVSGILAA